ncbi:MAG: helix-turn-helix domain-containing protein [Acetatifactor sp.]|nr:helix-turn-helix domain-containing protein [Acetatifactor sp.]
MQNIKLLIAALEYIESHLCDDIKTEDVAAACYCSKATLERLFRCVNRISVHDYVIRRRMMRAAKGLSDSPDKTVLEIALEHGYSTHESFARAFKQVWNCKPSEFRNRKYTELYPRIRMSLEIGGKGCVNRKQVDISELYDLFQERKNCYFVCCDIKNMVHLNRISRKAGDLAIIEAMNRMNQAAGENDMVFRIGGDEFCILTDSCEQAYAEQIAEKIRSWNEGTFSYEETQIPLYLYTTAVSLKQEWIKYNELFSGLHDAIVESKFQ